VRLYASDQTHSSIDKAAWIAGIGQDNLVKVPTDGPMRSMRADALETAVAADRASGLLPAGIIACIGGTSTGAVDDMAGIVAVARRHGLYVHVDAAWAGAAMICPEFRTLWRGVEAADSLVLNPHKWLGAQFDCSAHFVRDPDALVRTLAIQPEFLKTHGREGLINYSEWSVPLGRRFRALKLWFLLRGHGLEGLRTMIRNHVRWSRALACRFAAEPGFSVVTEPILSLFSFRHDPGDGRDLDAHNLSLLTAINDDGRLYLTQTRVEGRIAIRFQAGSMEAREADLDLAFEVIRDLARQLV
jgi:aromatic-L-amino-acid decarboxylase